MRTGGYTIQQTLTTEAASVLKQSLTLARRRGHAQVSKFFFLSFFLNWFLKNLSTSLCFIQSLDLLMFTKKVFVFYGFRSLLSM